MSQPPQSIPYDADFSHAMLIAVLVKLGGSIELDLAHDLALDALGDAHGQLYSLVFEPLGPDRARLSVHPRTPATEAPPE